MSSSTDLSFLQTCLTLLLRAPAPSSTLPPSLLSPLQTSLSSSLKLKLSPSAMRAIVQQLEELRRVQGRKKERRREKREQEGSVGVRRGEGWVDELMSGWEGRGEEEEKQRYAELLQRVRTLRRERSKVQQQLKHYEHLTSLLPSLSTHSITSHTLADPTSLLRTELEGMAQVLPGVMEEVEADQAELVLLKKGKGRGRPIEADSDQGLATTAGAAVVKLLGRR